MDADLCPYCASEQTQTVSSPKELHHQSLQDSLTSLYTPPYAAKPSNPIPNKPAPLKAPMAEKRFNNPSAALGIPAIPTESAEDQHVEEGRSSFWPILLLSVGANVLTIGLLQLFFSDEGFLHLEWDSSRWYLYCLAALPLFFFGFKKVNALKT